MRFEAVLTWAFLMIAALSADSGWAIAAGVFAVADGWGRLTDAVTEEEMEK